MLHYIKFGALAEIKSFGEKLQAEIAELHKKDPEKAKEFSDNLDRVNRKISRQISESMLSIASHGSGKKKDEKIKRQVRRGEKSAAAAKVDISRIIDMYLNAHVHSLNVDIGFNEGPDTSLKISDITSTVSMKPKDMTVTAGLREITMKDETPNALHKKLLSVGGDKEVFHMDFTQYNRTAEEKKHMSLSDVDMSVKIRFAQLRFVFLNLWVNRMLTWIHPFQAEAALAAQQAQVAVSEKATETAQNVKQIMLESPPRLHLDIKLAAPAIIVPRISTSNDVFLVNLGQLELRNAFEKSNNALIDQMTIQLSDMHASVGVLVDGDSEKISSNTPLLKPISFSLSLFRNLNFSQIKDLPELAVKAYLPAIDVSMSQFDYALMMHTLAGNLAEGTPPPPAKPLPPPPRIGDAEANGGTELVKKKSGVEEKKASDTKGPPLPKNAKRIVFKFVMDKIHAGLYSSKRAIESNKGNIERNIKDAFASMKLQGLLVTGYMQEDNGLDVAITLDTFSMSDEREGKNTIKQLMDKKPGKQNAEQKFVQLKFNQNYRGDKDIIINSSAFFLFLSPEFLGQLASFFVAPPPPEANNVPPEFIAKKRFAEQQAALTATPTTTTSKPKTPVATPDVPVAGGGALALRGSIQDIEIILIENALNPKNSQALILSFSAVLDGETKDGKQKINGQVKDLQIVSTYFAEEMRHLVNYYVLNRMNILLDVEIDMETQDQIVSGKIDTVHLKVSPDVIRLLSAVATQFSEHRIEGVDTHDPKKPIIAKYPNYWFKKKFNRHEYWWFSDVAEEAIEGFEPQLDVLPIPKRMEKAVFSIDKFIITLEVGTDDDTVPMILLESTLRSTAANWSSRLSCDAEMKLQISYYNEKFSVWEPIIEPVLKEKHGVPSWEKWNVTAKVRSASEDEDSEEGAAAPPKMQISIDAVDVMNITVTKSLLNLLTQLSNAFEKAAKQISPPKARPLPGTSPYLILNDSGVAVKVANSDSLKVSENGDLIDATHGDFVELNIIGYQQPIGLQFSDDTQKAELCLELMSTTREINVMRAEKRAMRLPKQAPSGRQWTLVVDTNIEQSRRVVTLKSLVSFLNHTDTPLEIQSLRDTTLDLCGIIENDDEALNVPLPLLYTPTGEFFIRPANDQYESSNESFSWHNLETKHRGVVRCNLSSDERQCLYFDLVAIEEPVLGEVGPNQVDKQWTIHIYPPMVLRNLLPFPIKVLEPMAFTLEGGDEIPVNVVPGHRMIYTLEYEESYTARLDILEERTELDCITFVADKDANKKLHLGIHWSTQNRRLDCQLYAPFWLVNNTNKTLCYMEPTSSGVLPKTSSCRCSMSRRGSHNKPEYCIKHEPNNNPILLPFADKNVASKKKAKVKVGNSAWSDEFPLDTAGTAARVICPDELCQYELTVDIQVCQSGLTKVVSFAPFYLCHNDSKFDMQVREPGASTWTLVPAEAVAGIWPMQKEKRKL
uniref:Vacuolar protein sorting-associated protein 13C n=1 Tax=Panagrolaimus davidi TaxID=227884 RepID=A0A914Q5H0_9BILA